MATSFAPDRSSVPGPSTWLPGGAYWAFRKDPLAFFTHTARTYGDIAGFKFGPQKVYLVSRPEWIEDALVKSAGKFGKGIALERAKVLLGNGLLTAAGQEHLKHRRMIQPLFHRQHVQGFADTFVRHAARWRDQVTPGADLDLTREMSGLTLGIIGETMFSSDVQGDADAVREALTDAVSNFAYAFIPGQAQLQFFLNVAEFGMNVQQALEQGSIVSTSFKSSYYPHPAEGKLQVPASLPRHVLDELAAMGHKLDIRNVRGVGSVKAIIIHPRTGVLMGGVSPTRDSYVMAY